MKKATYLLLAVFFIGLLIQSCEIFEQPVTGSLTDYSDCKSSKGYDIKGDTPDTLSCINYVYDASAKKLYITHINAAFNCCPQKIFCRVSLEGEAIVIKERERSSMCDCDCIYDLEIEAEGVESRVYWIKIIEAYSGYEPQIFFEADLVNNPEGSFCVTRKNYPWGMSQYR